MREDFFSEQKGLLEIFFFTFLTGKVLSRSKKLISWIWRLFRFRGLRSPKKCIIKNVRLSVRLSFGLSALCRGQSEDTIVTFNLEFGMWTQNVNISSHFFDIIFILITKGILPQTLTALTLKRSKVVSICSLYFCHWFFYRHICLRWLSTVRHNMIVQSHSTENSTCLVLIIYVLSDN